MEIVALIVFAYLLGSIPTGYILGKFAGVDVRQVGSGNVGATNVARAVGKWQGVLTLLADAMKGMLPAAIGLTMMLPSAAIAALSAAAFLGHLYPIFLNFRGGKGVATALGALLVIAPLASLLLVAIFAAVVFPTRLVSLSSIVAAASAPFALWLFLQPRAIVLLGAFLAAMIVWRHRGNIQRLRAGTEPRFDAHSSSD
ncbi:MAG: glycerol-3-phosphate 1-O-acyltransferase PlsY [Candidatus Binatia bacterium]|nr:glycerol-3-phosphate 1-O-acyltransferase PlsY [Candidatus Deferrimicrobium sp.]